MRSLRKTILYAMLAVLCLPATASATSPWGPNDEAGNGNTQGYATYVRAAIQMVLPGAKAYRLAQLFSSEMPQSPFSTPWEQISKPTAFIPFTLHAGNGDTVCGEIGGQGTQMDALGHFGYKDSLDGEEIYYYNGFTQDEVKGPDGLLKLGIEKSKPIVTTALLLDARKYLNGGQAMGAGQLITADDIEYMRRKQRLPPILPGDVIFIYTGWSDHWQDDNADPLQTEYYSAGPGLSYDAALFLQQKKIVLVGLDNPFTDPVNEGFLQGMAGPPLGAPDGLPFSVHHNNLTQAGIYQIQNLNLKKLAQDRIYLSAVFISPLPIRGASGSPVAPIAIGAPWLF